ncbi:MAG: HAMP domain-containing histidine kinase [Actinomycetota bacterium]|nr:HAMP domain-containing histidine kinase [Actinomycetota bacterium]
MAVHVAALSGLIDDLFELSRLEAGEITWSLRQVDLATLVGDTVDALEAEARAKGVRMRTRVPEDLPPARANPEKLQRVLFNLIHNAIRHTPADGSVAVLAEPDEAGLVVEVADTGEGIPPVDRERCSSRSSGAATARPAAARGRGSGWPSPAASSRPTAGASGWRTRPAAPGCASACR